MKKLARLATLTSLFAALSLGYQLTAEAAKITASSGIPAVSPSDPDSKTWRFTTPTAEDTITWYTGENETDGVTYARRAVKTEPKFNMSVTPPGEASFGFSNIDGPGPKGSRSITFGAGTSSIEPGTFWGTNYLADWVVSARGMLGKIPPPSPTWTSTAEGKDPYNLTAEQFSDLSIKGPLYDLFFAAGLEGGDYSQRGSIGFDVFYETASGLTNLLSISLNNESVTVTGDNPSGLSIYLLNAIDEGPTEISANLTSLSAIQAILEADVASDRRLDSPLYFGFIWDDITVPTVDLSNGSIAKIRVETIAADSAIVPEPLTILGSATALGFGAFFKRKRKLFESSEKDNTKTV